MKKKVIEGGTFSVWYDAREDRLRVAINKEVLPSRADLWITRRFFLTLVMRIESFLASRIDEKVLEYSRDTVSQSGSIEKIPTQEMKREVAQEGELSEEPQVELLENFNIQWGESADSVRIVLESRTCRVESTMRVVEFVALLNLLIRQVPVGEWGRVSTLLQRWSNTLLPASPSSTPSGN